MKRRRRDGEGRKQSASGAEPRQGGRRRGPGTSAGDRAGRRVPQGPAERPTGDQVDWRAFPPGGQHTASYYRGRGRDDRSKPARRGAGRPVREEGERSEEHTSELQSLMRISYAVFCLKTKK